VYQLSWENILNVRKIVIKGNKSIIFNDKKLNKISKHSGSETIKPVLLLKYI